MNYWERWEQEGKSWRKIFAQIDPFLAAFAESHGMKFTRWHWDAPDRMLTWGETVYRNIHLYVEGDPNSYKLVIETAAWEDHFINGRQQRYLKQETFTTLPIAEDLTLSPRECAAAVEKAFDTVSSWPREELGSVF